MDAHRVAPGAESEDYKSQNGKDYRLLFVEEIVGLTVSVIASDGRAVDTAHAMSKNDAREYGGDIAEEDSRRAA